MNHPGQLVTKEQVLAAVWPGTYIEEGALTICIAELRKALGDDAKTPRFIETVHGRGYRFLPTVTTAPPVRSLEQFGVQSLPQAGRRTPNSELRDSPLVGRESELAQLNGWLDKAISGERQLVFVTGEPGIGKTSLVETFCSEFGVPKSSEFTRQIFKLCTPNCLQLLSLGLGGGSASSSMARASRTCRFWKRWDD